MKRLQVPLLLISMLLILGTPMFTLAAGGPTPITIKFGNTLFQSNKQIVIIKGRTFVPLRDIYEALGQQVSWNASTSSITAKRGNYYSKLTIGSRQAQLGKKTVTLNAAPMIYQQSTYVPLRFVAESVGAKVAWDAKTRCVIVTDSLSTAFLKRAIALGRPLFWKIADVNRDGQQEFILLLQTAKGRQLVVFNQQRTLLNTSVNGQINGLYLLDLNKDTRGVVVYRLIGGAMTNVTIFGFSPNTTRLGQFAVGKGNVKFITSGGQTKVQVIDGKNNTFWEYTGSKLVPTNNPGNLAGQTGTSTPNSSAGSIPSTGQSGEYNQMALLAKTLFSRVLSGNLESTKEMSTSSQVQAKLEKSMNETRAFIAKHPGETWKPASGAVVNGSTAQYYNWIKYLHDSGYLVVFLERKNSTWVITGAEFRAVPKQI